MTWCLRINSPIYILIWGIGVVLQPGSTSVFFGFRCRVIRETSDSSMKKHQENRWSSRNVPCTLQFAGKFALYLGRFERSRIVCVYDILYMYIYIHIHHRDAWWRATGDQNLGGPRSIASRAGHAACLQADRGLDIYLFQGDFDTLLIAPRCMLKVFIDSTVSRK